MWKGHHRQISLLASAFQGVIYVWRTFKMNLQSEAWHTLMESPYTRDLGRRIAWIWGHIGFLIVSSRLAWAKVWDLVQNRKWLKQKDLPSNQFYYLKISLNIAIIFHNSHPESIPPDEIPGLRPAFLHSLPMALVPASTLYSNKFENLHSKYKRY